jgi:hypothetical protein
MLIEAPEFEIGHHIEVLALQGDWDLKNPPGPAGGRLVISDPDRAHQACMTRTRVLSLRIQMLRRAYAWMHTGRISMASGGTEPGEAQ